MHMESPAGSWRLFQLFGINVFVHWSWLLVAFVELKYRRDHYHSIVWNAAEYLTIFAIVLLHEFGHALATLSVGGKAEQIMLWPLGGVAFVQPPQRPGAVLWSIFAGPLVNILLLPVLFFVALVVSQTAPDTNLDTYVNAVFIINLVLLIFNMLPIYPLDGGQILHSLLWFAIGYAQALRIVSVLGFLGAAGIIALAVWLGLGPFTYIMAAFIAWRAYAGFQLATNLIRQEQQQSLYPPPWPPVAAGPTEPSTPSRSSAPLPPPMPGQQQANPWDRPQQ